MQMNQNVYSQFLFYFEKFVHKRFIMVINCQCKYGYCHKPFENIIIPLWMDTFACMGVCVSFFTHHIRYFNARRHTASAEYFTDGYSFISKM